MNILNDTFEKETMNLLNEYGKMPVVLLKNFFPKLKDGEFYSMLESLENCGLIRREKGENGHNYCFSFSNISYNPNTIDALWVFSQYCKYRLIRGYGALDYPSSSYFIRKERDGKIFQYEIIVLDKGDIPLLRTLNFSNEFKYILVLREPEEMKEVAKTVIEKYGLLPKRLIIVKLTRSTRPTPKLKFVKGDDIELS